MYLHSTSLCRRLLMAALIAVAMGACGGGGGGSDSSSAPASAAADPSRPIEQSDLQIADGVYGTGARTPTGFYTDPVPAGHGYISTVHLKNADIDSEAPAPQPLFELCTNDWNQALAWSEASAQNAPQYADLVATNDEARFFEFGRVRPGDPSFYQRTRVFKCDYLDRSGANLRAAAGPAGRLNQRPLAATDLRQLSEYLWQFTPYNNSGNVVLKSSGAATNGTLTHTLHIGTLVRNAISASCDRIDVIAWRHTLDPDNGQVQLDVQVLWSFGARDNAGVAVLCSS